MSTRWMTARAFVLLTLFLALATEAQAQDAPSSPLPRCAVCTREVPDLTRTREHRGREVYLCSDECADSWDADPSVYFARLQPRGALFQESAQPREMMPRGGFWIGIYVLIGLLFGALSAYTAIHRRQPAKTWFFAGLFLNVFALGALLLRPTGAKRDDEPEGVPGGLRKVPTTRTPTVCPQCGHENHPSATQCNLCGTALTPSVHSEVITAEARAVKVDAPKGRA